VVARKYTAPLLEVKKAAQERSMARRIKYRNWITEVGFDPRKDHRAAEEHRQQIFVSMGDWVKGISDEDATGSAAERQRIALIKERVALAISQLTDDEREFVERFYYSGETFREISERSGKAIYRLEALQRRALRRLRKLLKEFVAETFGMKGPAVGRCPLCESPHRAEIDQLIRERDRNRSWRPVVKEISEKFGIAVRSPMTLIGHEKYH
jgi:DNA-directed RNA polymerase specialized sigma24 family protein